MSDCDLCGIEPVIHYRVPTVCGIRCVCRACYARHARVLHRPGSTRGWRERSGLTPDTAPVQLLLPFANETSGPDTAARSM